MPNSPTAGGPAGTTMGGPLHITTDMGDTSPDLTGLSTLFFQGINLTTGQSDTGFLALSGASGTEDIPLPKSGSLVALTLSSSATFTAAPPTVAVHLDGVDTGMSATLATGETTITVLQTDLTSFPYESGQVMSVVYDSAGGMAPAGSVDILATIWMT